MYIDNLVEIHSHIIPGVDDGSQSIETSLEMIERLKTQGAKKIVLTSGTARWGCRPARAAAAG